MTADSDETGREKLARLIQERVTRMDKTRSTLGFNRDDALSLAMLIYDNSTEVIAALSAAPVAQEPVAVAYQYRTGWDNGAWTDWADCGADQHERIQRTGKIGSYVAQSRPLYTSPPATSAGLGADEIARHGIYIASKTKHADRWRFLRDKVGEPIISTWIDEAGEGESSDLHDLWRRCLTEASSCQVLIAYREKDEALKGGWVEIGAALSSGIPVYAVGLEEFTIAKYRGITHFPDMKSAIAASRAILALLSRGSGER